MKKIISALALGAFLATSFVGTASAQSCQNSDFTTWSPYRIADDCLVSSENPNPASVSSILDAQWGEKWSLFAKLEDNDERGFLDVDYGDGLMTLDIGSDFLWLADPSYLNQLDDAVFVVKQAKNWAAYLFTDLQSTIGTFSTTFTFGRDDYSNFQLYGKTVKSVPEIDGASAGIAISLSLSLVALMRERRKIRLRKV